MGRLQHLEQDVNYQATLRVLDKLGLGQVSYDRKTSMPFEQQFWEQFDVLLGLSEEQMLSELPYFVTDPSNQAKVEALYAGRKKEAIGAEESKKISASLD